MFDGAKVQRFFAIYNSLDRKNACKGVILDLNQPFVRDNSNFNVRCLNLDELAYSLQPALIGNSVTVGAGSDDLHYLAQGFHLISR